MRDAKEVSVGVAGIGGIGGRHARNIFEGKVEGLRLAAVCDREEGLFEKFPETESFLSSEAMIRSGKIDAIIIATPHYFHTEIGIDALEQGLHVLVEKPMSVHKADCERLLAAHRKKDTVFAIMLNERTLPPFKKLRELIRGGELGVLRRVVWIITHWYRTEAYYRSSDWRATWSGEGGGVLLNQCLHQLDLWQWMFGMPARIRAFCEMGRYHDIEVEDDVTAYMEYEEGAKGILITTTGEFPGTNRLEVAAENGKVVIEGDRFQYFRNKTGMSEFSKKAEGNWKKPEAEEVAVQLEGEGGRHLEIMRNFSDAIRKGTPLLAPAAEGVHSVELANAMICSSIRNRVLELPLDGKEYESLLRQLIAQPCHGKK